MYGRIEFYFDFQVFIGSAGNSFRRESTLDILRAYLPYQETAAIGKLYAVIVKQLHSTDHKEQKKSYKVLEELCASDSPSCVEFLNGLLDKEDDTSLQKVFLQSLSKASPSSQASRYRKMRTQSKKSPRCA